ncbi:MAG: TadE/TadG family type IV pilus assembly protein, partial [Chloroflexota bacterium]
MSEHKQSTTRSPGDRRTKSRAQAMVEFGLALPILLMVMYGLIESGRLLFMYASVVSAARQAARYGSVTGDNGSGTPYYNDCAGIRNSAKRLGFLQPFRDADILISYDTGPAGTSVSANCPISAPGHPVNGDRIRVQVTMPFAPIVPLVPFDSFPITSIARRTLLVGVSVKVDAPGVVLPPGSTGALAILKDATPSSYETLDQVIIYHYLLTNLGTDPITDIAVSDDRIDAQGGTVTCPGTTLAGGASFACQASYVITQADIDNRSVTNTATATGLSNGLPVIAQASFSMNFVPRPELTLSKSGTAPALVDRGQIVEYVFTLLNSGNVVLAGPYTITDANLDSWSCAAAVSPLAVGATTSCTGTHALTNNDINTTYIDNSATATAKYGGFTVTSNVATAHVLVPELFLVISAAPPSVSSLGEPITYTYTLTNRKAVSMSNLKVSDTRGAINYSCLASLASTATNSCTRTYSGYTQADMDAGLILNQGTATAQAGVNSNQATATVAANRIMQLTLTKTASPTS